MRAGISNKGEKMKNGKKYIALVSALVLTFSLAANVQAKAADPVVKIMVGGLNKQIYLPFKLAENLGMYKKYGVTVELSDEPSGVSAEVAMLAGQVDLVGGFFDHNIDLQVKGKATQSVIQLLKAPGEVELCRTDLKDTIKSPADWKSGINVGVTGLGSSTNFLTKALAKHAGVDLTQVHSIVVGAGATFIAAMKNKTIDCGMTTEPTISAVLGQGLGYVLVDMRYGDLTKAALGGVYVSTCVYGRADWISANPDSVQRVVNAFYDTLQWIHTHTPLQVAKALPADYYAGVGLDAYVKALTDEYSMYNINGRMINGAPNTILKVLTIGNGYTPAQVAAVNLNITYTNTYAAVASRQVAAMNLALRRKTK